MTVNAEIHVTTLSFYAHICPHCGMGYNYYAISPLNSTQKICPLCGKEIDDENSVVE